MRVKRNPIKKPTNLSYVLWLRQCLQPEYRQMPIFQNGSSIFVENNRGQILLEHRTDRDEWCPPGGLQEMGETFEEVAIRELFEETGLKVRPGDLHLIGVVSGESRYATYPNGDQVYNNSVLYVVKKYSGRLSNDHSEVVFDGKEYLTRAESRELRFFDPDKLPENLMDRDLIDFYIQAKKASRI